MATITDIDGEKYEVELDQRRDVIKVRCTNSGGELATICHGADGEIEVLMHDPSFLAEDIKRDLEGVAA